MNALKQLAGQTVIYGLPTIGGRLINYLLVFLHTRFLTEAEFGVSKVMYGFVAFMVVILTYGMETAYFRYYNKEENKNNVFGTVFLSILSTSAVFLILMTIFAQDVANLIEYPQHPEYIVWFAFILAFDAISSIPYAKLRAINKARKFAMVRFMNILINVSFNVFFIYLLPLIYNSQYGYLVENIWGWYQGEFKIELIFIANLIASLIQFIVLMPEVIKEKFSFDYALWKKLIVYALPLMFFGLAGIANQTIDRILLKYILPDDIAEAQVGIYAACFSISIIMSLFVQAFRYAAEPFFFSRAKEEDARKLFATMMEAFVIVLSIIFLGTMLYLDDVLIYLIGPKFREGKDVVPVLLYAFIFLGISYNLSIWYKLTNRTSYGAWLATGGAVVTVLVNIVFIPKYGYMASAWATFTSNAAIMVVSYFLGQKYYRVPYRIPRMAFYLFVALGIYYVTVLLDLQIAWIRIIVHTALLAVFCVLVYVREKTAFRNIINS